MIRGAGVDDGRYSEYIKSSQLEYLMYYEYLLRYLNVAKNKMEINYKINYEKNRNKNEEKKKRRKK